MSVNLGDGWGIGSCGYCNGGLHGGSVCPRIAAIEYHPNGTVKRVELHPVEPAPSPPTGKAEK